MSIEVNRPSSNSVSISSSPKPSVTAKTEQQQVEVSGGIRGEPGPTGPQGPIGPSGPTGPGVPEGGQPGYLLKKSSDANYETEWVNPSAISLKTITSGPSSSAVIDEVTGSAIKYIIKAETATGSEITEILALVSGSSVLHTEYAKVATGSDVAEYDMTITDGVVELVASISSVTTFVVCKQVVI